MNNKKGALDFWVKIIIGVVLGLLVFSFFTSGILSAFQSSCLRETMNELKPLVQSGSMGQVPPLLGSDHFYLPFTARGSCINKIVFASSDGYSECRQICTEFFGPRQDQSGKLEESCLKHCGECENKDGCIIIVTKRPSAWNYALPWRILETYKRRTDTIYTLGGNYGFINCDFSNCELEAPKKGTELYCMEFQKEGDYYSIRTREVESGIECQNYR